jgi:hypothetical protein
LSICIYTQMPPKIGFCLRRTATKFPPACIAKLFKFSCFGAASAGVNLGRLLGIFPTFEVICVYNPLCDSWKTIFGVRKSGIDVHPVYKPREAPRPLIEEIFIIISALDRKGHTAVN